MTKTISAEDIKEKLRRVKVIEVQGMSFSIRKVSLLLLLDNPGQIWDWARQGPETLVEKIKALLQSPSIQAMRRALLAGVTEPRVAETDEQDVVPVDMILANHQLAAELFIEIVNLSLGD